MTTGIWSARSWPLRLNDHLERLGIKATVKNFAERGSTSQWAVFNIDRLREELASSDIILIDYELNDRANRGELKGGGETAIRMYYRLLIELLVSLPHQPAVVDILTFSETASIFRAETGSEGEPVELTAQDKLGMPTNNCGAVDLSTYHHWIVNKEFRVPVVSYTEAICDMERDVDASKLKRTYWMKEDQPEDSPGSPHPGSITHDLLARVVLGFLLGEMDAECLQGDEGAIDYPPHLADKVGYHIQCLTHPSTSYSALGGIDSFRPLRTGPDWRFFEDRNGKPGWIKGPFGVGDIVFSVETRSGWLQLEYLGTYENIGYATVFLDDDQPTEGNRCDVNAVWADKTSSPKYSLIKTNLPPGRHNVSIRAYNKKFKLTGLAAC